MVAAKKIILFFGILFLHNLSILSQSYPASFSQVVVVNGLSAPTAMAFAPDGRIFICQQSGALKIVKNGVLLASPALSLSVNSSGERGLLGIAFDPDFINNQYIYLYYTTSTDIHNRVSRFKMNGDIVDNMVAELQLLNLETLSATNHNGGGMAFGPDGKLYIAVGDNATPTNAQSISNRLGKILRINTDGTIPVDNPSSFPGINGNTVGLNKVIWSIGLRNPYTLAFQPVTGVLFVNEVGQNNWEEIDDCTIGGKNYGWPATEGNFIQTNFPNYTMPVYAYSHGNGASQGYAITGGTFLNASNTNYPTEYIGNYFFMDYSKNWIDRLTFTLPITARISASTAWTNSTFASGISGSSLGLTTGSDGNLYYLSRAANSLIKIVSDNIALPVNLLFFKAESIDNKEIKLIWQTSNESNPLKFEILRSNNFSIWETIGEVNANQKSTETIAYNYLDKQPNQGFNYYKLKMVDTDGKYNYSNIVFEKSAKLIALKPNPTANEIFIELSDEESNNIQIINSIGENLTAFIKVSNVATYKKIIDISRLPIGKYFIVSKSERFPFIKN